MVMCVCKEGEGRSFVNDSNWLVIVVSYFGVVVSDMINVKQKEALHVVYSSIEEVVLRCDLGKTSLSH